MTDTRERRSHLTQLCLAELLSVATDLNAAQVSPSDSLLDDLMLDSFSLAAFADRLDRAFPDVDMTQWLMAATRGGQDTIDGLVSFLLDAGASAERTPSQA